MPGRRAAAATGGKSTTARDGNARERGGAASHAELVKLAKRGVLSHTEAANELGLSVSSISMLEWCKVLVEVGEWDEIPATTKSVQAAKDKDRNRWELIAARAGVSVTEAKNLYGDEDEVRAAAVRGGGNGNGESKPKASTAKATGRSTGGRKAAAASASSTKRSRTLAERRAAARNNPS
jgi:hypothetical protein